MQELLNRLKRFGSEDQICLSLNNTLIRGSIYNIIDNLKNGEINLNNCVRISKEVTKVNPIENNIETTLYLCREF